jgi:hypothetical protein
VICVYAGWQNSFHTYYFTLITNLFDHQATAQYKKWVSVIPLLIPDAYFQDSSLFLTLLFSLNILTSSDLIPIFEEVRLMRRNVNPNNEESKSKLSNEIIAYVLYRSQLFESRFLTQG